MFFEIDPHNGIPIYDQVVRQIKYAIARGLMTAGDRVPSVRELAKELVINPNTIARAYQSLQQEAIIEPIRGVGFQICPGAKTTCRTDRRELIRDRLTDVLVEAHHSGLSDDEIESLYNQAKAASKRRSQIG